MPIQKCTVCGSEIEGKAAHAKTCSDACRQKAYRQRVKYRKATQPWRNQKKTKA